MDVFYMSGGLASGGTWFKPAVVIFGAGGLACGGSFAVDS